MPDCWGIKGKTAPPPSRMSSIIRNQNHAVVDALMCALLNASRHPGLASEGPLNAPNAHARVKILKGRFLFVFFADLFQLSAPEGMFEDFKVIQKKKKARRLKKQTVWN